MDYQDIQSYADLAKDERPAFIESVTLAGGPIRSRHFQTGPKQNYNESHTFTSLRVDTRDYGRWAMYALTPNSENRNSFGIGYVTKPLRAEFGKVSLEASLMAGIVTGYQEYPLPMVGGNLRLEFYERSFAHGKLSIGAEASVMPYVSQRFKGDKWQVGIVGTTPYLSARYTFGKPRD